MVYASSLQDRPQKDKSKTMKKEAVTDEVDEILPEYDFSKGVRGKYYQRYMQGTNVVLLDKDVAEMFPDSESVNRALRALNELMKATKPKKKQVA
jgi:hypothetical protein